jgi:hypothetical protein
MVLLQSERFVGGPSSRPPSHGNLDETPRCSLASGYILSALLQASSFHFKRMPVCVRESCPPCPHWLLRPAVPPPAVPSW